MTGMATDKPMPSPEQISAWGYYGMPRGSARVYDARTQVSQAVGEVRYVVGWMADQMVRMGWRVTINDSETWRLTLEDGTVVTSDSDEDDPEAGAHPSNASRTILEKVGWCDAAVRQVTTNLFVAGELYYLLEKERWQVASIIDPNLQKRIAKSDLSLRGLWPHPGEPESPDAPLFGVLSVLDDLLWVTRLERSQSANRVAMRGILLAADTLSPAKSGDDPEGFWDTLETALSRGMDSPSDVAPLTLRGPAELVKDGAGLHWIIPDFPYDDKIGDRMQALIQRLAWGLPVPPEILLGMQAQSRATAFQVEGNAYRAHLEPAAWTVAQIPQDALTLFLPDDVGTVRVVPDPTAILARRHSIEDVLEAFDRGAVGYDYLREALGIPTRATPTEEDLVIRERVLGRATVVEGVSDPDEGQADDVVNAAAALPADELITDVAETDADRYLSERLARIDADLFAELIGASDQAILKARERLGAAVRSKSTRRGAIPDDLTNDQLATKLGADALAALDIDVPRVVENALAATLRWWTARLARAQADIAALLSEGDVPIEFDRALAAESVQSLSDALAASVFEPALDASRLREVISLAGS